jgi:hypothetical protein
VFLKKFWLRLDVGIGELGIELIPISNSSWYCIGPQCKFYCLDDNASPFEILVTNPILFYVWMHRSGGIEFWLCTHLHPLPGTPGLDLSPGNGENYSQWRKARRGRRARQQREAGKGGRRSKVGMGRRASGAEGARRGATLVGGGARGRARRSWLIEGELGRSAELVGGGSREGRRVTTPPEIIPYYLLNHSIWSLSDNKEVSR